jgi:hypothetical protein
MNTFLAVTAAGEAAMGLALLAYPPIVIRLLLGVEITGAAVLIGRVTGIALIGLGVACWPNGSARQPLHGMLAYSTLAALYLIYVGIAAKELACCCGRLWRSTLFLSFFSSACALGSVSEWHRWHGCET